MCVVNSWKERITDVKLNHKANDTTISIEQKEMEVGEVSSSKKFTAYSNHKDDWHCEFTDSKGKLHTASMNDYGFKERDKDAVVVAQITKENGRLTLYFPVSSDKHTDI